uniref:Uncharacterized protein n=1 Tax=Anguilla anguilla TaxID=7936 RepID=A0A0E9RTU8_ANGAN
MNKRQQKTLTAVYTKLMLNWLKKYFQPEPYRPEPETYVGPNT